MTSPSSPSWRKSTYSGNGSDCVEMADPGDGDGHVLVRDSKDPSGPVLRLSRTQLAGLLDGAKAGEFDDFT